MSAMEVGGVHNGSNPRNVFLESIGNFDIS